MKKPLLNTNSGFSIVEVLIASVIVAVAMLGIMQAGTGGAASGKSNTADLDFAIITSNLQTTLNSDCSNLLGGQAFTNGTTPNPAVNLVVNGYTIAAVPVPLPSTGGLVVTNISLNKTPVQVGLSPLGNIEYQANLHIQASKFASGGTLLPGAPTLSKDFPVMLWVNPAGTAIVSCAQGGGPTGATLTVTPGLCTGSGTNQVMSVQWNCTNPTTVSSASVMSATGGGPFPLPSPNTPATIIVPTSTGNYSLTLLLTDLNGVQSFGMASPSPQVGPAGPCP